MLNILSAENPSRSISMADENGERVELLHVSCHLRPGSGVNLNIDVFDAERVAANQADVRAALTEFIAEAFARASSMGLPVPEVGGGSV